ncbi:MAG: Crp/Fnr family transcriptional regulator [Parvularculaceae bacterium]
MGDGVKAASEQSGAGSLTILQSERWFSGLEPSVQNSILRSGFRKRLKRGQILFRQGDEPAGLFGVLDGQIHSQAENHDGKTVVLAVFHAPDWVGFLACAEGKPYTFDVVASIDSELLFVPLATVRSLLCADPKNLLQLIAPQLSSMRKIYSYLMNTLHHKPIERLAFLLIDFSRSPWYEEGDIHPVRGLSQEILAASAFTTRQDVNKFLGELEKQGLIKKSYGQIEILDAAKLMQVARMKS